MEHQLTALLTPSVLAPASWSGVIPASRSGSSHAAAAADAAGDGRYRGEPGMAPGAGGGRGAEGVGPGRPVGDTAVAGQLQALTKRLDGLPAAVMGQLFAEVCTRVQAQAAPCVPHPRGAPVRERFPLIAMVDGATLEALRQKTQVLRERAGLILAGKTLVMVAAFSHRPLWQHYTEDAAANDKRFATEILAARPVGGLLVFDLGFFSLLWFADFTGAHGSSLSPGGGRRPRIAPCKC